MKLIKEFQGVPDGEIYPVTYGPGDDCPPELEATARHFGALELPTPPDQPPLRPDAVSEAVPPIAQSPAVKPVEQARDTSPAPRARGRG